MDIIKYKSPSTNLSKIFNICVMENKRNHSIGLDQIANIASMSCHFIHEIGSMSKNNQDQLHHKTTT